MGDTYLVKFDPKVQDYTLISWCLRQLSIGERKPRIFIITDSIEVVKSGSFEIAKFLYLGTTILHTAGCTIFAVKQKQHNLRVELNDNVFNIDFYDETLFLRIETLLLEEEIFFEFDEFMAMTADENYDSESDTEEPPFEKIAINTDYKIKTSLEEPPTDLELKPLPDNLEYVFLEEPYFPPVIISSQLSKEKKNKLVSVLKKHKEAFAWKTTDIPEYHFMVKEGIVLGHKVSSAGLEVDKAKINVISKLPPPTNIKGIRSLLGHASFYQRFIKDFLNIARPLTKLLEKDTPFKFDDECQKAFELLKEKLTCAPVIVSPNWNLPFKLMCDASDFAVGAILGQKDGKSFQPIYFVSKP
ncbi:reverse transcriptase domain-containing protein [Tanacetum coccineum]